MELFSDLNIDQIQENVQKAKKLEHAHTIQEAIEKASYVGKTETTVYDWTVDELNELEYLGFKLDADTDIPKLKASLRISWEGDE